ncbi:MAG: hypothetical protein V1908_01035 [Candidatus Peregrinibacteria bacterium]
MRKDILKTARAKFRQLSKKYNGFIHVILDDWRGYRFIYDTVDVRRCKNQCADCPLYQLLKNEKTGRFSAGLYKASKKDKSIFGPQKFLNCKTLSQYRDCYVNFLVKEAKTRRQIIEELQLIKNLKIIYAKTDDPRVLERQFKQSIIRKATRLTGARKRRIIASVGSIQTAKSANFSPAVQCG